MGYKISQVEKDSLAWDLELEPGDELLKINGKDIIDIIDFQSLSVTSDITLTIKKPNGDMLELTTDKDEYEPLGLSFEGDMLGKPRTCGNKCIFCFVDQLPKNLRETLYMKDDDWRMSLIMGNFVTLTNVSDSELDRIIERGASPLYISVHTTNPELRVAMMHQPRAAKIMEMLKKLANGGIEFHLQAVICPGYNDGDELERTVADLAALYPAARSLALVTVGLTQHREGLKEIEPFNFVSASDTLDDLKKWQKKYLKEIGTRFVFASDEFYCLAKRQYPSEESYEGYPQIENGVGLMRKLEDEYIAAYNETNFSKTTIRKRSVAIATGLLAAPFLRQLLERYPVKGVIVSVHAIENNFFGKTVTVTGLLTGSDIIRGMQGVPCDEILIPHCMLREGGNVFLDDTTIDDVRVALNKPIYKQWVDGYELLDCLIGREDII